MSDAQPRNSSGAKRSSKSKHGGGKRARVNGAPGKIPKPDVVLLSRTNNQARVHEGMSVMLHQGGDGGVFCLLQLVAFRGKYVVFTREGKQGEDGKWRAIREPDVKSAERTFKKTFRDKTGTGWLHRDNFEPQPDKYVIANVDEASGVETEEVEEESSEEELEELDPRTKLLAQLILDRRMLMDQLAVLKLDTDKVDIDRLTEKMFEKAEEIFSEIQKAIKFRKPPAVLKELWTRYLKAVPHQGPKGCPQDAIAQPSTRLFREMEVMTTLSDIKTTWEFLGQFGENTSLEEMFYQLGCKAHLLDNKSEEYKMVSQYAGSCSGSRRGTLLDVWRVARPQDAARARDHDSINYRKLLWQGVNVAQVAAVLHRGLTITPFSTGTLGRGIYFTPEHAKASWNVGVQWGEFEGEKNVGFMVLAEVALGRMCYIKMANSSLTQPPDGFDSVAAKGRLEPDACEDEVRRFDGRRVIIPVGSPVKQREFEASGFPNTQYVVYKESQAQLRYLVKFSFA